MTVARRRKVDARDLEISWLHYDPIGAWRAGRQATLSISDGRATDLYLISPHFEKDGRISHWVVEKCQQCASNPTEATPAYHVGADFSWCDCPWGTYRSDEKACRHRVCLARAILLLGDGGKP